MIEGIAMLTVLAGMGIYFVKSTDIPKDLKEKSAQLRSQTRDIQDHSNKTFTFAKVQNKEMKTERIETKINLDNSKAAEVSRLVALKQEKLALIELQNKKIDQLTLAITALEQELKANNDRNAEIQAQIDIHLAELQELNRTKITLNA